MGLVSDLLNASITGQDLLVAVVTLASIWWAKIFYVCFLRAGKNLKKQYGEWAVVTGATDGIGKAMAVEFSKKGMKVLLISRDPKKLEDTKAELSGEGHETLAIDYSSFDDKKQEQVKKALEGKDLGILVNNVGVSYDFAEYFHLLDKDKVQKLMSLNIDSTVWMTYHVIPHFLAKKKSSGAIINLSSFSAVSPAPLLSEYSAAKKFVIGFSESLHAELKHKNIDVQAQVPLWVTTKMAKVRNPSLITPSTQNYAKAALKAIGYDRVISPYWSHYVFMKIVHFVPLFVMDKVTNNMHVDIRRRAYKKYEKEYKKL